MITWSLFFLTYQNQGSVKHMPNPNQVHVDKSFAHVGFQILKRL